MICFLANNIIKEKISKTNKIIVKFNYWLGSGFRRIIKWNKSKLNFLMIIKQRVYEINNHKMRLELKWLSI